MTRIKHILTTGQPGETLTVKGWVRTKRAAKKFTFIEINDGSSMAGLQAIAGEDIPDYANSMARLNTGASIAITGTLAESPGKGQRVELQATAIEVFGESDGETYPLQKKRHSFEFLREIGHLRSRTNTLSAVFRVRNACATAIHQFFQQQDFLWMHTPILTASDCEGAGEMFTVTRFNLDNIPTNKEGKADYSQDFFWQTRLSHRQWAARSRNHGHGLHERLHLWPHLSRRELKYFPPSRRILDGRARNGLLRPRRQHGLSRSFPQAHFFLRPRTLC